jgi:hypothetical protein
LTRRETEELDTAMPTSKKSRIPTDVTTETNTRDQESRTSLTSDTELVTTKVSASDRPTVDTVLVSTDTPAALTTTTPMVVPSKTMASAELTTPDVMVLPRLLLDLEEESVSRTLADADTLATADMAPSPTVAMVATAEDTENCDLALSCGVD